MAAPNYRIRLFPGGGSDIFITERRTPHGKWFKISLACSLDQAKRHIEEYKKQEADDLKRREEILKELGSEGVLYIE